MSSIAAPNPTEELRREIGTLTRTALGAGLLAGLLVTITPFESISTTTAASGNPINQLGYGLMAGLAILGQILFADRRVLLSLLRPTWLLMILWLVLSASQALDPQAALRAFAFTLAAMIAATGALTLPAGASAFRFSLALACGLVLGLSYAGVLVAPSLAIHTAEGAEAHHAGLWRGLYSHKNIAGAVMAAIFFAGIYLARSRQALLGTAIAALAFVFVLQTGSKTAAVLLPAVAILVMGSRLIGGRWMPVLALVAALAALALLTIGTVILPLMDTILQRFAPGTTFTGRTDLWRFALDLWSERRWTGFGFESFWRTGAVLASEPSRELAWDPRGATNAHNGYLDIAIATGLPGLALGLLTLVVLPLADFLRAGSDRESIQLADLFLMILGFGLMNAFLESFLFERANPVWMTLWISVIGLRLLARHPLAVSSA